MGPVVRIISIVERVILKQLWVSTVFNSSRLRIGTDSTAKEGTPDNVIHQQLSLRKPGCLQSQFCVLYSDISTLVRFIDSGVPKNVLKFPILGLRHRSRLQTTIRTIQIGKTAIIMM